jgi:hypothetical protein
MAVRPTSYQEHRTGIRGCRSGPVQNLLAKTLFGDDYGNDDDPRRNISCLPVKWAGLAIPNPTLAVDANYEASTFLCSHILAAFRGVDAFRSAKHKLVNIAQTSQGGQL